jgi:transcriptional regulator with XRE-family HTH domain
MEITLMPKSKEAETSFNYPEIFKAARERGKFSQQEYAKKLQINVRSYERIEAGDTNPSADTLMRFLLLEKWIEKKEHEVREVKRKQDTKPKKECISCHRMYIVPSYWLHERCPRCQGRADFKDMKEFMEREAVEAELRRRQKRAAKLEAANKTPSS